MGIFPTTFLEIAVYMYNLLPFVVIEMDVVKLWINTKLISKYRKEDIIKEKVEKRKFCARSELKFCDVTKCHLIIFCFDERKKILNETILEN